MLWEKCFIDFDGPTHRVTENGFNPFVMPRMLTRDRGSEQKIGARDISEMMPGDNWKLDATKLWYGEMSWGQPDSICVKISEVVTDFHNRLTCSAKELFAPARYLKSPAARYSIEACSYVTTALLHVGMLFGDFALTRSHPNTHILPIHNLNVTPQPCVHPQPCTLTIFILRNSISFVLLSPSSLVSLFLSIPLALPYLLLFPSIPDPARLLVHP